MNGRRSAERVLSMIVRDNKASINSISDALGVPRSEVVGAADSLKSDGVLRHEGGTRGSWRVERGEISPDPSGHLKVRRRRERGRSASVRPVIPMPTVPVLYDPPVAASMFARDGSGGIAAIERMKERMGLRWTETVSDIDLGEWECRLADPVEVTVRSSGLGWEAYSSEPAISCRGRSPSDAMGFYRFCLAEYESA